MEFRKNTDITIEELFCEMRILQNILGINDIGKVICSLLNGLPKSKLFEMSNEEIIKHIQTIQVIEKDNDCTELFKR